MTEDWRRERLRRNLDGLARAAADALERRSDPTVERLRRNLATVLEVAGGGVGPSGRPRAAVAAWDLTHNPVGRALVLAELLAQEWDVDLVGPMWRSFGTRLWSPAAGDVDHLRSFPVSDVVDYLPRATAIATSGRYDLVVASKYRLPSLHLGTLLAEWNDAPLLVDIDDLESTLAVATPEGPADTMEDLFDGPARRLEEQCVEVADARTVVSPPLQERFGGVIVRHARSRAEPRGSPAAIEQRRASRARFDIPDHETAVFFIGTVRPHKGVDDVVAALHELGRRDIRLHVFTTTAPSEVAALVEAAVGGPSDRWALHGHCRLRDVPALLAAADAVVLAQDVDSPISTYQVPAKISDAAAVGIPVLAPELPAYRDLAEAGLVETYPVGGLVPALRGLADRPSEPARAAARQRAFAIELSRTVNSARLDAAVESAIEAHASRDPAVSAVLHDEIIDLYERKRTFVPDDLELGWRGRTHPAYDLAFFWKQNDSDLYGRRSDMIVRHAAASGRMRAGAHFDAAVDASTLVTRLRTSEGPPQQAGFELAGILERHLGLRDDRLLARRCFLHAGETSGSPRLYGRPVAPASAHADYVLAELDDAGIDPARTVAWVWPIVPGLDELLDRIGFGAVVCDLVDDQRTWPNLDSEARQRIDAQYRSVIGAADLVITNSPANAEAFAELGREIVVVGNGADPGRESTERTDSGASARPTLGYVGDMQDRIDWELLELVAAERPDWDLVLVGEVPDRSPAHQLAARHANVRLTGVVPYEPARELMRGFTVGIVPHVRSTQSLRMDPLKIYNYLAMGLAVVATVPPANGLTDARVAVAGSHDEFLALVADRIERPGEGVGSVEGFGWDERVSTMFELIDSLPAAERCRVR